MEVANFISSNVRCLFNKMDELSHVAKLQQPSIINIQETWADPSDSDGMYAINGYKLIRADRDTFGGGVATYIPHSCQHETITIPMTQAECIWIRITIGQASLLVGNIYRPPRSDPAEFVMELERAIKLDERPQDEILLLGDFNAKNTARLAQRIGALWRLRRCFTHQS